MAGESCDCRGIPGYVRLYVQLEAVTRIMKAVDRTELSLGVANPHFIGVFCRPSAARRNRFILNTAYVRGSIQPCGRADQDLVLAAKDAWLCAPKHHRAHIIGADDYSLGITEFRQLNHPIVLMCSSQFNAGSELVAGMPISCYHVLLANDFLLYAMRCLSM